jgi:hypothetical protein
MAAAPRRPAEAQLSLGDAAAELGRARRDDPARYAEILSWFRAKRTQLEMVVARGYTDPAPPGDALQLVPDFEWLYFDAADKTKIGYDLEWEEAVFPRFYQHFANRAARLTAAVKALPRAENVGWDRVSFFDALSNVYYSAKRDCYLYIRFTDASYAASAASLANLRLEREQSNPIAYPGFRLAAHAQQRAVPRLCHVAYVFPEAERDNRQLKALREQPEVALPDPQVFFLRDLVSNPTDHYLNPEYALLTSGSGGHAHTQRGQDAEAALSAAAAARAEEDSEKIAAAGIPRSDLPLLLPGDPISLYYGAAIGDVIAVTNFPRYNTFVPAVETMRRVGLR